MQSRGFTLFDLLITLVIISVLFFGAVPALTQQLNNNSLKSATNDLLAAIEFTRNESAAHNSRATMTNHGEWTNGWDVFMDKNNNGILDNDESIIRSYPPSNSIKIIANRPIQKYVSFIGSGESRLANNHSQGAFQAGTFKICAINSKAAGYEIVLARSGRARIKNIGAEECL